MPSPTDPYVQTSGLEDAAFGIGDVVAQTGVAEGTLRMWERRHGFPEPVRLPNGHRRYSVHDIELVRAVLAGRSAGLSLAAAISRAWSQPAAPLQSVYATLRRNRPDLEPRVIAKPLMLALTNAIEEESLARAERALVFGSFQRALFFRQSQRRWRELTRSAELAVAFADFRGTRVPHVGPVEIPVDRNQSLAREWAVICDSDGYAVCLAGWELPARDAAPMRPRTFETIWSVEPQVVRQSARICAAIAATAQPELLAPAQLRLEGPASLSSETQLRLAAAITNRTLSLLSER